MKNEKGNRKWKMEKGIENEKWKMKKLKKIIENEK
jgi:hypothetical protein